MYDKLSENQKKAVDYNDGNLLILAGAGSGKTRVLTERIRKKIDSLRNGEKIIALTFTNKAAEELKERIYNTISADVLDNKLFVGTIHDFCLEIVLSRGNSIGLPQDLHIFESDKDRIKIFRDVILDIPIFKERIIGKSERDISAEINDIFYKISKIKKNLKYYYDYSTDSLPYVLMKDYEQVLLSQGAIDFDDILSYTYKILNDNPEILKIYNRVYKSICIDEAQDLNKAQYEIIKLLAGEKIDVTMVGDISQSIYGFNGSSSKYFANDFGQDFNAEKIELLENFRSSKKVIEAAKKIDGSFNIECVWPIEGEFEIYNFSNQYEEARWVLEKIDSLKITGHNDVEGKVISDDKIAIIGRNRYVFKQLELLLKENKRPYILKASNDNSFVCESVFMKCFELGIKLIVNPKDRIHLVELSQKLSITEQINNLDDIKKYTKFNDYWTKLFKILVNSWNKLSPDNAGINMEVILKKISDEINENDILEEDKNLIYNDIKELINLWRTYVKVSDISNRNLSNFLRSRALGQVRIDSESGITLSTVHMSKGLEYDVVFIIGLIEGVFPDYRSTELKDLEEEKHNLFVAITRSKRLCYLTYPDYKENYKGDEVKVVKSRFVNNFNKKI